MFHILNCGFEIKSAMIIAVMQVMRYMTFVEMHVKWSVTLTDQLGAEILTVLEIKGQVLHRVRLHVKVSGWLSNFRALLTKRLPKSLSRLNEMSSSRENVFSFGIIAENFEVFENDNFTSKVLWMVGKGEWNSVFSLC